MEFNRMLFGQSVERIMNRPLIRIVSEDITASEVLHTTKQNEIIVVENQLHLPSSVTSIEKLSQVPRPDLPLRVYRQELIIPAIVRPDTPLELMLKIVALEPGIQHYLVMQGQNFAGSLSREALSARLGQSLGVAALLTPVALASFVGRLFGNPVSSPPKICYACVNEKRLHCMSLLEVERDKFDRALCPDHKTLAVLHEDCPCHGDKE